MLLPDLLNSNCDVPSRRNTVTRRQNPNHYQWSQGIDKEPVVEVDLRPEAPGSQHGTEVEVDYADGAQKVLIHLRIGYLSCFCELVGNSRRVHANTFWSSS